MILVYLLILSVLVGYLRKGRLRHYAQTPLRGLLFPIFAFLLEAVFGLLDKLLPWPPEKWLWAAVSLEYAMLFVFIWLNRRRRSFVVLAAAAALNFAVIAANGFRMPVTPVVYDYPQFARFVERVSSGELLEYVLVGWDAPLWWLGDTIPVPWIMPGLASVGDVGLGLGVFLLLQEIMCPRDAKGAQAAAAKPDAQRDAGVRNGTP